MTTALTDSDDRTEMREALEALLGPDIGEPVLLAGGASKEAWAVDAGGERLLVRRAAGGVIHRHTLSLAHEFEVLEAAYEAGVKVPRPITYVADLDGREAFVMERLDGETIGRRIVRMDVPEQLPLQLAEELAKIHAIPDQPNKRFTTKIPMRFGCRFFAAMMVGRKKNAASASTNRIWPMTNMAHPLRGTTV